MTHAPPGRELLLSPIVVWLRLGQEAQMAVYIGVDLHVRTQTLCWVDDTDGEQHQLSLDNERDDVRAFYSQFPAPAIIGVGTNGYSVVVHRTLEELGHQLRVGDA